jgi:hypothetical protein
MTEKNVHNRQNFDAHTKLAEFPNVTRLDIFAGE